MKLRSCTAFLEDGSRHDVEGDCTRVVIRAGAGSRVIRHWVCADCRERMELPDRDVDIVGGQVVEPA